MPGSSALQKRTPRRDPALTSYAPARSTGQAQGTVSSSLASAMVATTPPPFGPVPSVGVDDVIVRSHDVRQFVNGFGAALTDSAAYCLMNYLTSTQRANVLTDLFGASGWSTVRIGLGATDFQSGTQYTYDDMPSGQTDPSLVNFSTTNDGAYLIPLLKQIQAIRPSLRIIASIWFPPAWLKAGSAVDSAQLQAYANYIVKAIQAYASYGLPIWSITAVNEPVASGLMSSSTETTFISTYLGPAIVAAGLSTQIWAHDDNFDQTTFAQTVLTGAGNYISGVAWHAYSGVGTALRTVQASAHHITEIRTLLAQDWASSLATIAGTALITPFNNGASSFTLWNLALDQTGAPITINPGRRGVVTIPNDSSGNIVYSAEYYVLKHIAPNLQPGARLVTTTAGTTVQAISFLNPDGSLVIFVYNSATASRTFQIIDGDSGSGFPVTLPASSIASFVWGTTATKAPAGALAPISVPTATTLTATGLPGGVQLSWTGATSAASIMGYQVLRDGAPLVLLPATTTSYLDFHTTTHTYVVYAISAAGNGAQSTSKSATASAATAPGKPSVSAITSSGSVQLTWGPAAPNGSTVTQYIVGRSTTPGAETQLVVLPQGSTTYVDSGIPNGTTYYYTVTAVNATGSTASSEVSGHGPLIAIDNHTHYNTSTSSASISFTHTINSSSSGYLLVGFGGNAATAAYNVTSVTANGVAMSSLAGAAGGVNYRHTSLFGLKAVAAGTVSIVITLSVATNLSVEVFSLTGVNQTSPTTAAAGGTAETITNSVTVTGAPVGALVFTTLCARATSAATVSPGTVIGSGQANTNTFFEMSSSTSVGADVTTTWTLPTADTSALSGIGIRSI